MISHKHKCIFIHISRTGGSTIERLLQGEDRWNRDPYSKHITTARAKKLYSEWWDDYFKFTFVRNPYDRVLSQLHTAGINNYKHLGINTETPFESFLKINKQNYINRDCVGGTLINNFREVPYEGCIYRSILAEGVDKVYKYENYEESVRDLLEELNVGRSKDAPIPVYNASKIKHDRKDLKPEDYEMINELYDLDFEEYDYKKVWK